MLKEVIDKFYLDGQKNKEQHHFYVSQAGKCPRQIFFKFKNAPAEKMDARILRIYEKGEYLHRNIVSILIRLGIVVASEINIPSQEMISGRADVIVSLNGELYLVDIKSMNSMVFRNLTEPKEENVSQLQLYLHYFKIKKGILFYIDKDKQDIKEFIIDYNPTLAQSILDGFTSLKKKIENNIIPSRLPDYPDDWECKYCQFKEICIMGAPGEMNWDDFKKKIESQNQGTNFSET